MSFIAVLLVSTSGSGPLAVSSASRAGVGQQRHLAGVLDRGGDEPLLLDGHTGHPTSADLAAVGDELAQERGVLVVDVLDLRRLERVGLLLGLAHYGLGHRGALHSVRARSVCSGIACGSGGTRVSPFGSAGFTGTRKPSHL